MKRSWHLLMAVMIASTVASAETGIRSVVSLLETRYAVRHHGIPGLWLTKPFLMGSGVGGLKMAKFTNFHVPPQDSYSLKEEIGRKLGSNWQSFLETWSKDDAEWCTVYAKESNGGISILIVQSDKDGGLVVIQVNLSRKALDHWVAEPLKDVDKTARLSAGLNTVYLQPARSE